VREHAEVTASELRATLGELAEPFDTFDADVVVAQDLREELVRATAKRLIVVEHAMGYASTRVDLATLVGGVEINTSVGRT
jgi:hypothetical protein